MTRKVSTLILRASKVSSGTAIAAASDVSLNSDIMVCCSDGRTLRSISGAMIEVRICISRQADGEPRFAQPTWN